MALRQWTILDSNSAQKRLKTGGSGFGVTENVKGGIEAVLDAVEAAAAADETILDLVACWPQLAPGERAQILELAKVAR